MLSDPFLPRRRSLSTPHGILDPCRAVQSQGSLSLPHSEAAAPGDQLGGVRRRSARPRQPDRVVHAGGGRRVDGRAAHQPGWAAHLLRSGDHDSADPAGGVPPGAAPNGGADRLHPAVAWSRSRGARPLHPQPPGRDAGGAATEGGERAGAPAGGRHGAEALRPGRVAGREARHQAAPAWRVLHLATDADTGHIVASVLTDKDADDGSQVGPLLDRIDGTVASVTGGGACDREDVYAEVTVRHPAAAVVVPPRANAVPSKTAGIAPT